MSRGASQILQVLQWPGIGQAKVRAALRANRPTEDFLDHAARLYSKVDATERRTAEAKGRDIEKRCEDLGISVLGMMDEGYPPLLRLIGDPPPVVFVRGDASALIRRGVAVVGTREASKAGLRTASVIASFVSRRGYSVVSGLALGIDTAAHVGALDSGGITVAVLAHGLDRITPASNRGLAERILENRGALIAEHPPGVPPRPPEYVRRNRIQSGLSVASVIVESGEKGGAVHQANFTRSQGRKLITVLPTTESSKREFNQAGALFLIDRLGAVAIRTTGELDKVLSALESGGELGHPLQSSLF